MMTTPQKTAVRIVGVFFAATALGNVTGTLSKPSSRICSCGCAMCRLPCALRSFLSLA